MTRIVRRPVALVAALATMSALLLSPIAASAGSATFDLPRLDFGTMPAPQTVRSTIRSTNGK